MTRVTKFEDRQRILLLQLHRFSVKQAIMLLRVFVLFFLKFLKNL
jgi:hypothetical protein